MLSDTILSANYLKIMAKVTGPLMSLDASGTVANTATFSKWKGRNYVRQRVIPMNRQTDAQQTVRSVLGTIAKACSAVLTATKDSLEVGSQFFVDAVATAIAGQSWISSLQKTLNSNFASLVVAFNGLSSTIKGYYNVGGVDALLATYTDKMGVAHTAGEQLYLLADYAVLKLGYTGFASGINSASEAEITAFVSYITVTV